jgi:hypothetical protein
VDVKKELAAILITSVLLAGMVGIAIYRIMTGV